MAAGPRAMRRPMIVCCIALGGGLWRGETHQASSRELDAAIERLNADRFVEVTVTIDRGWIAVDDDTFVLRTRSSVVTQDQTRIVIGRPLSIYAPAPPPEHATAQELRASGFLRRRPDGRISMSVKSQQLIEYSGKASPLDPRQWNRTICARLDAAAAGNEHVRAAVPLVKAIALGRSEGLPADLRRSYREGGTYHLLVFSGMQIAIAAASLLFLLRWLRRPRVGDWLLLFLALLAPPFAGNEPSVSRASLMIGTFAVTRLLYRPTHFANLIFVSAVIRLLLHPEELTHRGFILTYVATTGLIVVGHAVAGVFDPRRRVVRTLARGVGAELALLPVTHALFNRVVVGSSVITFFASPLVVAMLATSAAFCAAVFLLPDALVLLARAILLLDQSCRALNSLVTLANLSTVLPAPPPFLVVGAYITSLVLLLRPQKLLRLAAVTPLAAPLIFTLVTLKAPSVTPRVDLLDVGQGDAILLRSGSSAVLVDGGGILEDETFGERVLLPRLLQRNVRRLDAVVLTHPHPDHCGGLAAVLRELEVGELLMAGRTWKDGCARDLFELARKRGVKTRVAERERHLIAPGIVSRVLTPRLRFKRARVNNGSVVLDVHMEGQRILLTGDVERDGERLLVGDHPELRADVLKVAHHGSRSSTSEHFLRAVSPRLALISAGRRNLYGHPSEEVLENLRRQRVPAARTDRSGSVTVFLHNQTLMRVSEFDTSQPPD